MAKNKPTNGAVDELVTKAQRQKIVRDLRELIDHEARALVYEQANKVAEQWAKDHREKIELDLREAFDAAYARAVKRMRVSVDVEIPDY